MLNFEQGGKIVMMAVSKMINIQLNLTTIADPWYFGRVVVPQRLINLSLYHEILLLQKFNGISGKVLKPKQISLQPQKKNEAVCDCV